MDLGCLDMGCISVSDKLSNDTVHDSANKESDPIEPISANSKSGKKSPKGTNQSSALNALNKFTSQIKKPSRKNSPLNWFPRKKGDSYLKRKIKMLQEVDGMNLTLDETLGDTNPHYSRVLREKMAAREAAHKAMEARKAALVEASWCRILKAARIQSKEAEALVLKSEKAAAEAFEAATAMGVVMYDTPNCPQKRCEIETTCVNGGASTTHTVTASFETAFEVDKEVAAAVKTAFVRLARCPSFSKDEFRDLLHTISENPDTGNSNQELSEFSSECESESGSEFETAFQKDGFGSQELDFPVAGVTQSKSKWRPSFEKFNMGKLVDMMVERLRCLEEHELSSLANIVATCGLNAALAEVQNGKTHPPNSVLNFARRMSSLGVGTMRNANLENVKDGPVRRKQIESELPSLDKFLVKHTSKLEREVQEAKNSRKKESGEITGKNPDMLDNDGKLSVTRRKEDVPELPSLDKFLVKRVSRLEKEVQEAKSRRNNGSVEEGSAVDLKKNIEPSTSISHSEKNAVSTTGGELLEKENIDLNKEDAKLSEMVEKDLKAGTEETVDSLDKILVKPVQKLEETKQGGNNNTDYDSLDKVLVKHVSKWEKEKRRFKVSEEEVVKVKRSGINRYSQTNEEGSLDQVLVKHKSRLEREKIAAAQQPEVHIKPSVARREARERELQEAWGGLSLGNSMQPLSKLEKDKQPEVQSSRTSAVSRREARDRVLQETWGGLSLGNSIKPHVSRLERDKAAWIKAEEEQRRQAIGEV